MSKLILSSSPVGQSCNPTPIKTVILHTYSQLLSVLLRVETDRFDRRHNHHHTQRDGNKQHDHMLGSIFESQLLILILLAVCDHLRGSCGGRLSVQLHLITAGSRCAARLSVPVGLRPVIWLQRENQESVCVLLCFGTSVQKKFFFLTLLRCNNWQLYKFDWTGLFGIGFI